MCCLASLYLTSTRHHSQIPNLVNLDLSENPLFEADGVRELLRFLKQTSLRSLSLARCGLTHNAAKFLRYGASKLPDEIEHLDVDGNLFDDESAKLIASLLRDIVRHRRKNKNKTVFNVVLTQHSKRVTSVGLSHMTLARLEAELDC